jgi:hypothetical protein
MNTKIPNRHVMIRIAILILFLLLLVAACSGPSEVNEGLIVVGNPTPRNDAAGLEISQVLFWLTTGATSNLSGYDVYFGNTPNPPLVEEDYQKTFYDTRIFGVSLPKAETATSSTAICGDSRRVTASGSR